jgi:hypothetical protein
VSKRPVNDQQRYRAVMESCRDMVLVELTASVAEMSSRVEPVLLDFMEKADTNQNKFQFIDAVNVFKKKRYDVEQRFSEGILRGFKEFSTGKAISYPDLLLRSQAVKKGEFSLVSELELDKRLCFQTMVDKADRSVFQLLYALKIRLAIVRGGTQLEDQDIPGGTFHIASAFQLAADQLNLNSNMLHIVYALFEKVVMQRLENLYGRYNQRLINVGIFPNLKFDAAKLVKQGEDNRIEKKNHGTENRVTAAPPPVRSGAWWFGDDTPYEAGMPDAVLGEELFNKIRTLMAARRHQDPRQAQRASLYTGAAGEQPMANARTLAKAIESIQPAQSADYLPHVSSDGRCLAGDLLLDQGVFEQAKEQLMEGQEKVLERLEGKNIAIIDLDSIEIVGMLFEQVWKEKDLPNVAKALISNLHTPFLKVAIIDRSFLTDSRHVARRLLNQMVDASRLWIDEWDLRHGIYYPVQQAVNRILSEFRDDIRIFDELRESLALQVRELEKKAEVLEDRAREAERSKARLEAVRQRVNSLIQKRIGIRRLPWIIDHFLNRVWRDRMVLMMLRDPNIEGRTAWEQTLDVINDIIWVYEARSDPSLGAEVLKKLPGLRRFIGEGLTVMGDYSQPDLKALFDLLARYATGNETPDEILSKPVEDQSASMRSTQPAKAAVSRPNGPSSTAGATPSSEEKRIAESLTKLQFGAWFDLKSEDGHFRRLKLSWHSPLTRKTMFVDKSGAKRLVIPLDDLARMVAKGEGKILTQPTMPFVDRALNAIFSFLQKPFPQANQS